MKLRDCAPGDIITLRGGFPLDLARDITCRVAYPIASGIGVTVLDDFTLEPVRYGFAIAVPTAEVLETIEPTKYPKGAHRDGPSLDAIDPMQRRLADLGDARKPRGDRA